MQSILESMVNQPQLKDLDGLKYVFQGNFTGKFHSDFAASRECVEYLITKQFRCLAISAERCLRKLDIERYHRWSRPCRTNIGIETFTIVNSWLLPQGNFTCVNLTTTHLFCTLYSLIFFIVIDTCFELWIFSSLIDLYFFDCNWSLWRKTSTVVYSEMWLNRVIVHWLFFFDNLILYWVMFELLLFLSWH